MDLFSLLAKLTLDKQEYTDGLAEAEKEAQDLKIPTPKVPKPDTDDFNSGLKEAENEGNIFKEVMSGVWSGIKDALLTTGLVGLVGGLVSSLREGFNLAVKNGDAISKGAKNLQMSTKAYQEYEYTLGKSNIKLSELQGVMSKIDTIRSGKITEDQAKYFEKLGINADEASSGLMSAETILTSMMDSLADYTGTDKGAIIDAFFGKSDKWTGYFDQTKAEIDTLKEEAESLGLIMSEDSIKNAVAYQDATEKLAERLDAIKRSFGEGILPLITEAVNKLMMVMNYFIGTDKRSSADMFKDTDSKLAARIKEIESNTTAAQYLADRLLGMGDTSQMDADQLAVWKGTAASLIKMIPTLSGYIDEESGSIHGTSEEISELIKQYESLDKESAYQTARAEKENILAQKQNKINEESIKINEKLAEAEGKKAEAYAAIDEFLKNPRNEGYRRNLESNYGYTGTMTDDIYQRFSGMFREWMGENSKLNEYRSALAEATEAQANVDALVADLAEGTTAFEEWNTAQSAMLGTIGSDAAAASAEVATLSDDLNGLPDEKHITVSIDSVEAEGGHAKGAWTIPKDNYLASLHRGEMVLTASEARRYRNGEGGGNGDVVAAIQGLRNDMRNIKLMVGRKVFGKAVVEYGGSRMSDYIGGADSRAAAGYGT